MAALCGIREVDRAKTFASTPVRVATGPSQVGMTDEIVTEILPVNTLKPAQLVKDLESLIPPHGAARCQPVRRRKRHVMTACSGTGHSSATLRSAAGVDVRRSLDIEVIVLKYADAKSVASELKEIFQTADSDVTRAGARNNFGGFGGPGGSGGGPGFGFPGGGGGGGSNDSSSKNGQTHAVFISDDQMNAVVASAAPDIICGPLPM